MNEIQGDLWRQEADAFVITTNGFVKKNGHAVMGRGVALQAKQRYPGLSQLLGQRIQLRGNHVQMIGRLVAFPVKQNWWEEASIDLIKQSLKELVELTDNQSWNHIAMPRPGCGNGKLSWDVVGPILRAVLDERFTVVQR